MLLQAQGVPVSCRYPVVEAPSAEAAAEFAKLGVSTRLLDMPGFNISKPFSKEADDTDHNMGRFTIKAAVLLLTRFEEVGAGVSGRLRAVSGVWRRAPSCSWVCWLHLPRAILHKPLAARRPSPLALTQEKQQAK